MGLGRVKDLQLCKPVPMLLEAFKFLLYGVAFLAKSSMLVTLESDVKDSDFPLSYKARLEFAQKDDDDDDASSATSDEDIDDPFETVDSCPIDEMDDDGEQFSS
ncbi:j-domain protein required for chloroplastaccumulation response 1 [Striga asiatica]|uniref:J-domain protein required for chloroplastaccumulation response 1 n=1 Tax=Striga asiatica TaxID=4170 RepID=A0A5A7QPW3_STRAF|nr:j-domain protein required for chloroplastaccumulation response 1 [Striga asiatica]